MKTVTWASIIASTVWMRNGYHKDGNGAPSFADCLENTIWVYTREGYDIIG